MYDNPWRVESIARAQRGRLQEEMHQIRLEQVALNSRPHRTGLLRQVWLLVRRWFEARKTQGVRTTGMKHKAALESGADAFLVKGCPRDELVTAIVGMQPESINSVSKE